MQIAVGYPALFTCVVLCGAFPRGSKWRAEPEGKIGRSGDGFEPDSEIQARHRGRGREVRMPSRSQVREGCESRDEGTGSRNSSRGSGILGFDWWEAGAGCLHPAFVLEYVAAFPGETSSRRYQYIYRAFGCS